MSDGIRIKNLELNLTDEAAGSLIRGENRVQVEVGGFEISLSEPALNSLLARLTPADRTAPSVRLSGDGVVLELERKEGAAALQIRTGGVDIELEEGGLTVTSKPAGDAVAG